MRLPIAPALILVAGCAAAGLELEAGAPGQVDLREWQAGRAYLCEDDPWLDGAPTIPAADTAGLGDRIEAGFTGYRLSTEREIACRFPLLDGSTPYMYEPDFASGRAWWVRRADVNQDGRQDVVTVLTARGDPARDLLVVLFADGSTAAVGPLGGWGFGVSHLEGGPWVYMAYWEKATDRFRWTGQGFEPDPEACC